MSGPRPQPIPLKLLRGNPGKQKLPGGAEVRPPRGVPRMPPWLIAEAKAEWKRITAPLEKLGLLTLVDGAALSAYCQCYGRWVAAEKLVTAKGLTLKAGQTGYRQISPEVTVSLKYLTHLQALCAEFGFTPSSRSRMTLPGEPSDDEMGDLLS